MLQMRVAHSIRQKRAVQVLWSGSFESPAGLVVIDWN
jgi:hypothetical protein